MFKWLKNLASEDITPSELAQGAAHLGALLGKPYFTPETLGPDASDFVRKYGTETRVFQSTRHDN